MSNTQNFLYSYFNMEDFKFSSAKTLGQSSEAFLRGLMDNELTRDTIDTIQEILDPLFSKLSIEASNAADNYF